MARLRPLATAALLLFATVFAIPSARAGSKGTEPAEVVSSQIPEFRLDSGKTRFGALDYLGGIVMTSPNWLFGGLSSIRFRPDGETFVVVMDTGHWLTGRITRDDKGRLSGLAGVEITSMKDRNGEADQTKYDMDSEGVALRGNDVLVSFERHHRVDVYPGPGFALSTPTSTIPILIPKDGLSDNGSLESVAVAPPSSPLAGAAVIVVESSLDAQGNLPAAILDGPLKGRFSVRHHEGFNVSDAAFLPSGDLLLLQRSFTMALGMGMRIVRISAEDIKPGAVVDGPILMEADMGEQIDNMEGIDVVQAPDGSQHLILISDDNHSLFQRSIMLEFRLDEKAAAEMKKPAG